MLRSRYKVITILLFWMLASLGVCHAQITQQDDVYTIPLADLMVRDEPIMLRGNAAEYTFSVPLAERMEITSANLELRFVNSISLLSQRSQMSVSLNGRVVAQLPLKYRQPETRATIQLPVEFFQTGYNKLTFNVAQHYTESCENPSSSELWTQIDSTETRLQLTAKPREFTPNLAELFTIFDQRLWQTYTLHIISPSSAEDLDVLRWGALVAQGAALRLNYIPLEVVQHTAQTSRVFSADAPRSTWIPGLDMREHKDRDTVLIGTKEVLAPYLSPQLINKIENGFIGIYPRSDDPGQFMLIISGRNEGEVERAALAFAYPNVEFPDQSETLIEAFLASTLPPYAAKYTVNENQQYKLKDLGFQTTSSVGLYPRSQELQFWVPPDLFTPSDTTSLELHLHLAYGAGLSPLSALNIYFNDEFQHAIHLSEASGQVFYDYVVHIPMHSLRPGRNTVTFSPYMVPAERSGECQPAFVNGMLITLFDDSYLEMADANHFATLPDLSLFSGTVFPYAVNANGTDVAVQLTNTDSATVSATWTLLAKMAQITGVPFSHTEFIRTQAETNKHLLVMGAPQEMDSRLINLAPFSLAQDIRSETSLLKRPKPTAESPSLWQEFLWLIRAALAADPISANAESVSVRMPGEFSDYAAATQFESPFAGKKSVIAFTAAKPKTLQDGINALTKPALWGSMAGSYVLWAPDAKTVKSGNTGPVFTMGDDWVHSRLMYYFSQHPILWSSTVLIMLILFTMLTRLLLRRYKRQHHPHESG